MKSFLIFSDLDGTFLDHQNYSFGRNNQVVIKLKNKNHQLIFNSSKTYSEIKLILKKLRLLKMPFSCENGAILYFPKTIFKKLKYSKSQENYWKILLTDKNSDQWYRNLKKLKKKFDFKILKDLPKKDLIKLTNLQNINPMLDREASQLIIWRDNITKYKEFKKIIKYHENGMLTQGGRFIQISSPCNKRIATKEISHIYFNLFNDKYYKSIIALGDNQNDKAMLNFVSHSCVIKNRYSSNLRLNSYKKNVYYSKKNAPSGWEESLKFVDKKIGGKIGL